MRWWFGEKRIKKVKKLENWHKWFAWHPVCVAEVNHHKQWAWLEIVLRKGEQCYDMFDGLHCWIWDYRTIRK